MTTLARRTATTPGRLTPPPRSRPEPARRPPAGATRTNGRRNGRLVLEALERPPLRIPDPLSVPSAPAIRRRAYEIYERRAPDAGDALSDWLQAESELWKACLDANP